MNEKPAVIIIAGMPASGKTTVAGVLGRAFGFPILEKDALKDGAFLINTSRGALIDEAALLEALQSGKLCGAGLDVYELEPVTAGNPLFAEQDTVLAPHVSALTYETNYNGGMICARSIINVYDGGDPEYAIN